MFDLLGALKSFVSRVKHLDVDNAVFRLHYHFTTFVLVAFSIIVSARQYIGDPIDCTAATTIRADLIDQYCWVSSTISVPHAYDKKVGQHVPYDGVDLHKDGDNVIHHQYYQWVCFVLFLQGIMFYIPHYVWKVWESGRLKALTEDLDAPLVGSEVRQKRIDALEAYFDNSMHRHRFYGIRYFVCEVLNFVNVVGQMFLTNKFLGGAFLNYGTDVVSFSSLDQINRTDPMIKVFPRVAKCTFYTYGFAGNVQNVDALCVLPINIINEKIYIGLWFWFIILAVLSALAIIYRIVTFVSPQIRWMLLKFRANSVSADVIRKICDRTDFGDWFLLYLLSKNINSYVFRDVTDVIVRKLKGEDYKSSDEKQGLYNKHPL